MKSIQKRRYLMESEAYRKENDTYLHFSRRMFGTVFSAGLLGILTGCQIENVDTQIQLEDKLHALFNSDPVPGGLSAAVVRGETLVWSGGIGQADIDAKLAMTSDHIQNIGSISKTITATAVMQLWEEGAFELDDDINEFLPFSIRNPNFPDKPITFKQLLAHRSSIKDGTSYEKSYACGDPSVSLSDWIQGYFSHDNDFYDLNDNFHTWSPGTINPPKSPRVYSNVGYGVLGLLVEHITGELFSDYCQKRIFIPLQMKNTGWYLSEIDQSRHTKLYSNVSMSVRVQHLAEEGLKKSQSNGDVYPHCLYSFYNYPDGLLRTNVKDLSRFLRAYINDGKLDGVQILDKNTIDLMLSDQHFGRGLCWGTDGEGLWGHGGGDPGVATYMAFTTKEDLGVIILSNNGDFRNYLSEIESILFESLRQQDT